ncbi:MAG: CRTAC1 family protein, partial [Halobacteria archaeon]
TDVTGRAGAGHAGHTYHVAWGDYDRDGCLDLYLANYVDARALYAEPAHAAYDFARRDGEPNRLFRSNCEGTFTDVTQKSGTGDSGYALGAAFTDLDGDGWPDLYVSNDFGPNLLLRNLGDGTFEDVTTASGTGYRANGMGVDSGDVDNDGDLDLYVPNIFWVQYLGDVLGLPPGDDGGRAEALRSLLRQDSALLKRLPDRWRDSLPRMVEMGSALYLNRGGLAFTEEARAAGVHAVEWGWGGLFLDADLDGDIDLYVANGFDPYGHRRFFQLPNRLFLNLGNGTFSEAAARAGAGDRGDSRGAAYGDLDGDGALDLAVVNQGGPARLYRGDPPPGNHWLVVKPVGSCGPDHRGGAPLPGPRPSRLDATAGGVGGPASCSNRDGIGARVTVRAGNLSLLREVKSGSGHSSGSMIPVHFGLGENGSVGELTVRWPSGRVTTLLDVKADRALVVREPSG